MRVLIGLVTLVLATTPFASSAAAAAAAAAQPPDFAKVKIETIPLAPGLAMLMGSGGNMVVSTGANGPVLVDDEFAPLAAKIKAAIAALQKGPVRFVINTHHHFDHTGGNESFGNDGTLIIAQDNVRKRLSMAQFMKLMNVTVPAAPVAALPVVTFADGMTLHWNGEDIVLQHVPHAHTDGDVLVWFEHANVVHTGDTFVNGFFPLVDVDGGGTTAGIIAAAEKLLARAKPDTKVVPGHGPLATVADVKRFHDVMVDVKARVERGIASGKTMAQYIASKPFADLDAAWGHGFLTTDQVIMLLWTDLSRK